MENGDIENDQTVNKRLIHKEFQAMKQVMTILRELLRSQVIIVHGYIKKTQKTPTKELEIVR